MSEVQRKWFFEDHDSKKLYRYVLFVAPNDPEDCPPHSHFQDHMTRCMQGEVEVTLQMPGGEPVTHTLTRGMQVLVPAVAMHSAVGKVPNSQMVCEFDHIDGDRHPISVLGPRKVYC